MQLAKASSREKVKKGRKDVLKDAPAGKEIRKKK